MRFIAPLLLLAVPAADVPQPTLLPAGFVDPSRKIGIFSAPADGIQAIELASGKSFWQTNEAQRPLFVQNDRLYALAAVKAPEPRGQWFKWQARWHGPRNGFRLVAFDLAQFGQVVLESETVELPEWASILDGHDHSFPLRWHSENGRLVVSWEANAWYAGRIRKTPREETELRKHAAGVVRFDVESGAFETLPAQRASPIPPEYQPRKELERLAIRWQKLTPKHHLVLTLEETADKQQFLLRSFDSVTRQPQGMRELLSGRRLSLLPSLDEQYLCVRDASPQPDIMGDEQQIVRWSIFNLEGQRVAEVPYEPGTTAAALLDGRVYFLISGRINGPLDRPYCVPRSVRAIEMKTGITQWERAVGGKPAAPPPFIARPALMVEPERPGQP